MGKDKKPRYKSNDGNSTAKPLEVIKLLLIVFCFLGEKVLANSLGNNISRSNQHQCNLPKDKKIDLMIYSPYPVDDIILRRCRYRWRISNTRFLSPEAEVIKPNFTRGVRAMRKRSSRHSSKSNRLNKKHSGKTKRRFSQANQALELSLNLGVTSLASTDKATGATEKAASKIGYATTVKWGHQWRKDLSFFVNASLKKRSFVTSEQRALNNSDSTQISLGTGLDFTPNRTVSLSPEVSIRETLVLTAENTSLLSLDKISIINIKAPMQTKVLSFKSGFSLHLDLAIGYQLATNEKDYQTENSIAYAIGLSSRYRGRNLDYSISVGLDQRKLNFENAEQTTKDLSINTGVQWRF